MKNVVISILNKYLEIFPEEKERQTKLINYLNSHEDSDITNWNNFDGHIVAGGFIYSKEDNKFLVLYHKDLKMYLYPGGHAETTDKNPLEVAKREIQEETGLSNLKQLIIEKQELLPIDIDTHVIEYNTRLNIPEHYHFDFTYLFVIDKAENIILDENESKSYKWINLDELYDDPNYGCVAEKIKKILNISI